MISRTTSNGKVIIECQICFEEYDIYQRKPAVLDCGHSICQQCLTQLLSQNIRNKKCPFDNKILQRNFDQYPVNWSYIDVISSKIIYESHPIDYKNSNKPLKEYPNYAEFSNDEGKYTGQVASIGSFVKEGYGIMEYKDFSIYTGGWKNNKKNGKGRYVYADHREYDGEWQDNLPHGYGKFLYSAGEIREYEGTWRKGSFFGLGKITYSDDSVLESIFVDGASCSDILKLTTKDGRTILGNYEHNKLVGKGYEVNKSGDIYIGFFESFPNPEDKAQSAQGNCTFAKSGNGTIYFANGDKFEGTLLNNHITGNGVYYYSDGGKYEGELLDCWRNGNGVMVYSNGDVYDGSWLNNKRYGMGTLHTANGSSYIGEWNNDLKNGNGKLIERNSSYEGSWVNDKKHGSGVEILPNGETYCGDYKNGLKEGSGIYIFKSTDTYKGEWANDKMNGKGLLITHDGDEIIGKWSNGMLVTEGNSKIKDSKDKKDGCIVM